MDRKAFKLPFTEASQPDWQCPTCKKGLLRIKEGTFFNEETSLSRKWHGHEDWDPDWVSTVYSCLLKCTNEGCQEVVANSGEGFLDWDIEHDEEGYPQQIYGDYFKETLIKCLNFAPLRTWAPRVG